MKQTLPPTRSSVCPKFTEQWAARNHAATDSSPYSRWSPKSISRSLGTHMEGDGLRRVVRPSRMSREDQERRVWPPAIVVRTPFGQHAPKMPLIERNHPIETLTTHGPDHSFARRVHLRRGHWRFQQELFSRTFWNAAREFSSFRRSKRRLRESDADPRRGSVRLLLRPRGPLPPGSRLQRHGPAGPDGWKAVSAWWRTVRKLRRGVGLDWRRFPQSAELVSAPYSDRSIS